MEGDRMIYVMQTNNYENHALTSVENLTDCLFDWILFAMGSSVNRWKDKHVNFLLFY